MKTLSKEFIGKKRPILQVKDIKTELSKIVKFDWTKKDDFNKPLKVEDNK